MARFPCLSLRGCVLNSQWLISIATHELGRECEPGPRSRNKPLQQDKWQATRKIKSFILAIKHIMNANCLPIFIGTCLTYSILGQSASSIYLRSLSRPRSRNRLLLRGSSRARLRAIPSLTFTDSQDAAHLWDLQWHETYRTTAVVYCLSRRRGIFYPY